MKNFIIQYWLAVTFGLVITGFGLCYRKVHKGLCDQKSLRDGTKALLRNEIIRNYEKYKTRDWIPIYARENVIEMYATYHALGGNGAITKLYDELMNLDSSPKEGD